MREAASACPAAPPLPVPTSGHTDQVDKNIGRGEGKLVKEVETACSCYYVFDQFDHVEVVTPGALLGSGKMKDCGDSVPILSPSGKVCRQLLGARQAGTEASA